ncbi:MULTISPECIES: hypothetical protein [unclassified Roseofilum]|uniref:hypothetical protein n=1 Tax=unclassified Roseofilum TaxID=2620099 RepID=UPI000E8B63FF|nr:MULTISPECIES: hypothetical protein [unclassified Roseofilum]MBP0008994.1 hypothetical protein [Roseofilum sp. Belize Diploria]MBP0035947.1 hypothetical protein [Roseofilum sp. Belize BBD 4]HBQ98328.1 hypothetical protein [Cyanobacteria bacterium UBA11691]
MLDDLLNSKKARKSLKKSFSTVEKLATNSLSSKETSDLIYKSKKNELSDQEVSKLREKGIKGYKFIQENFISKKKKKKKKDLF